MTYRGTSREVVARPATAADSEEIFTLAATFYVGYRNYRQRIGDRRRIRVFVLEPIA
ncbi:MAG: nitroreductase/quinone reductase family protein [Nocardioides sp.]